ncbi:MAG: hypothetical protein WCT12_31185 [Verrucomicrobiota bacterium]
MKMQKRPLRLSLGNELLYGNVSGKELIFIIEDNYTLPVAFPGAVVAAELICERAIYS